MELGKIMYRDIILVGDGVGLPTIRIFSGLS
jgi:hypothetical protein